MDPLSPALIVEEQLNVAFRLVVNFSPLITIEELRTIRSRLARMDEAVGRVLATKALESRAQAVIDYVNVLRTQTASSSNEPQAHGGRRTSAAGPNRGRGGAPIRGVGRIGRRTPTTHMVPTVVIDVEDSSDDLAGDA